MASPMPEWSKMTDRQAGLVLFCTGMLGEVLMRTYFESQGRRIYAIREMRARKDAVPKDGR
jgi:hypothetical protein